MEPCNDRAETAFARYAGPLPGRRRAPLYTGRVRVSGARPSTAGVRRRAIRRRCTGVGPACRRNSVGRAAVPIPSNCWLQLCRLPRCHGVGGCACPRCCTTPASKWRSPSPVIRQMGCTCCRPRSWYLPGMDENLACELVRNTDRPYARCSIVASAMRCMCGSPTGFASGESSHARPWKILALTITRQGRMPPCQPRLRWPGPASRQRGRGQWTCRQGADSIRRQTGSQELTFHWLYRGCRGWLSTASTQGGQGGDVGVPHRHGCGDHRHSHWSASGSMAACWRSAPGGGGRLAIEIGGSCRWRPGRPQGHSPVQPAAALARPRDG